MHPGHAHFSLEPPPVPALPSIPAPILEPLSPLSDLSPSPPDPSNVQPVRTRLTSGNAGRSSQRCRDAADRAAPPIQATPLARRMRPLACMTSSSNANANAGAQLQTPGNNERSWKSDAWKAGGAQQPQQQAKAQETIEFPPKHVMLHPDDVNNKVFLAMGRALMSVNNCAMTIKDLAELSMQHGLVCQNVSAASQAITFFIRSHLNRCEEEKDFPLLLRHVLSGTPRDDALAPALYSRTGGNVSNKDKTARDENGNLKDRITCFRRGTTVWYLSKAAGAPCPFARAGIALRDYAEGSAITNVEGRKGDNDLTRGLKRKRERNLRRRAGSGPAARRDYSDSEEERKPTRIKLTLRLRPGPTTSRQTAELDTDDDDSSSSSSSDSEADTQDDPMEIDTSARSSIPPPLEPSGDPHEPTWTFPPYPIQRRISIPPYTPSEEIYPTFYTSPTTNNPSSTFFSEWPACTKPLVCVDPPLAKASGSGYYYNHKRATSVSSVASPPPDSEDEFGFDEDDDDDDIPFSKSPEVEPNGESSHQGVLSVSSLAGRLVKQEPSDDFEVGSPKFFPAETVKEEKQEEFDFDLASLSLSFAEETAGDYASLIKHENDLAGFSWGELIDLTCDDPVERVCASSEEREAMDDVASWRNVELLGPETLCLQDLEDGSWDEYPTELQSANPNAERNESRSDVDNVTENYATSGIDIAPDTPGSPVSSLGSLSPPPSLSGSVHDGSVFSPDTEVDSVGPTSPPSFTSPDILNVIRQEEPLPPSLQDTFFDVERSTPVMIPGKASVQSGLSRQAVAVRSDDILGIPLSEYSAPWERGMCTEEDVERHLLEPPRPFSMMSVRLLTQLDTSFEHSNAPPDPPLSPQEEAVFQSLCIVPDVFSEDDAQVDATEKETEEFEDKGASDDADTTLTDVFAQATRPTMRLRERRPSKRLTELEQARKQALPSRFKALKEVADTKDDSDTEIDKIDFGMTLRSRAKDAQATNNTETNKSASAGPPRRSKRVANVVAMQRNRERLRKRTVS